MKRSKVLQKLEANTVVRRYRQVAAYAVLGIFVISFIIFRVSHVPNQHEVTSDEPITETVTVVETEVIEPLKLKIPSIGIEADFEEPLGVGSNYEIKVPESYETVAYYKHGPVPGEIGPAVILGHVDSYEGPAVLYSLGQVEVGEIIEIEREDGSVLVFEVESLERHEQSGFPTREVYSDLDYPGLRIITCSGIYDRGEQRYSHNLIVFARLTEIREHD